MNILRFINSKAVREHLEKIEYEFNPLEAAWIIYRSNDATIPQKHKAWKELIRTMPDCEINGRAGFDTIPSLHFYLQNYMSLEDDGINEFMNPTGRDTYIYTAVFGEKNGAEFGFSTVFSDYEHLTAALHKAIENHGDEVSKIYCRRVTVDKENSRITVILNRNLEFTGLETSEVSGGCENIFDWLWFDFPTPFKKGDILWNPSRETYGIFVNRGICLEGITNEKTRQRIIDEGDTSDMMAGGYFVNKDGTVYSECADNYMDFEYYTEELKPHQRTLLPFRAYLKGEIDELLLVKAYHQILTNFLAEENIPRDYYDKNLTLAGIKVIKEENPVLPTI